MIFLQYISLSNVNFFSRLLFLWHVLRNVKIRVVWRRGSWVRVIQLCKERYKIEVQNGCIFFIKIYKQVIFQHKCIVSPVQSASGKALHSAWHFHRQNSSVLSYSLTVEIDCATRLCTFGPICYYSWHGYLFVVQEYFHVN